MNYQADNLATKHGYYDTELLRMEMTNVLVLLGDIKRQIESIDKKITCDPHSGEWHNKFYRDAVWLTEMLTAVNEISRRMERAIYFHGGDKK